MSERTYIAIDLKSFYASVECIDRGLDPMTTNLVVADKSRTEKTICLAVSPSLKAYGIPGRARLFQVVQKVREEGFAETISEYEQDIHSLGCPIYDHDGRVIASVSINWPLFREEPGKRDMCLEGLKKIAATASSLMGYKEAGIENSI